MIGLNTALSVGNPRIGSDTIKDFTFSKIFPFTVRFCFYRAFHLQGHQRKKERRENGKERKTILVLRCLKNKKKTLRTVTGHFRLDWSVCQITLTVVSTRYVSFDEPYGIHFIFIFFQLIDFAARLIEKVRNSSQVKMVP